MGSLKSIRFVQKIGAPSRGFLCTPTAQFPCAIGRSGLKRDKREGDGATPRAILPLRMVYYRHNRPQTLLKAVKTKPTMAWCDTRLSAQYNRPITTHTPHEESLQRVDNLYDFILVLGWNDAPIQKGKGSAIFWHIARADFSPTAGCYATTAQSLRRLFARLSTKTKVMVV